MPFRIIDKFLKLEASSGIVLFFMALAALILCNSSFQVAYQQFWHIPISLQVAQYKLAQPLLFWVNEGLMTLFFLHVGLELKREFLEGELKDFSHILLPALAAGGGMIVPAVIYCLINYHSADTLSGWAIPVATDIAFALGVLSLFGKRVPIALKLFLLALAMFDDVGAIVIIAFFHSESLAWWSLLGAGVAILVLFLLNKNGVRWVWPYLVVGLLLWLCVLQSGVHATVAGVLLAFMVPMGKVGARIEAFLYPWVMYFIMPLFAFANAGVSLHGLSWASLLDPLVLGIIAGLFVGKQLGVLAFSWLAIRMGWAKLPKKASWAQLYGTAVLCGIGFTMSLFLGTLAFAGNEPEFMMKVRLGVLFASLLSGVVGAVVLQMAFSQSGVRKA